MHWYQRLLCTLVIGVTCAADASQEVTIPALVGINRHTITAHTNGLIKSNNRNKILRAGCWTVGGILGLAACYTTIKDCSFALMEGGEYEVIKEIAERVKKLEDLTNIAEYAVPKISFWRSCWRKFYNAAFYPAIFGTVTFVIKAVFQDHTVQAFVKGRSTFDAVCKNIEQIGYAVNAIKAAPHVYTESRLDMVQASAVHAYNNFMRDIERVLAYMEFQVHHHALKAHSTQTDVDFVTFITDDFERSAQQAQDIATSYLAAQDPAQKIVQLIALHEHLMLYKNMFKLLLDNFERFEEQVALAL